MSREDRSSDELLSGHAWRGSIRFGFAEIADSYFASCDRLLPRPRSSPIARARLRLFAYLWRNAVRAVDRFRLSPHNAVEIAREIEV